MEATEPTPCPSCGRNTITVDGVCKECWAYKGDDGFAPRRPLVEEPASFTSYGFSMKWLILLAIGLVILVVWGRTAGFVYWLAMVVFAVTTQGWFLYRRWRS